MSFYFMQDAGVKQSDGFIMGCLWKFVNMKQNKILYLSLFEWENEKRIK